MMSGKNACIDPPRPRLCYIRRFVPFRRFPVHAEHVEVTAVAGELTFGQPVAQRSQRVGNVVPESTLAQYSHDSKSPPNGLPSPQPSPG